LSNAVTATLMAIVVTVLSRPLARRPAILHGLWLLVLIKFVTPPIYEVPIPWPLAPDVPSRTRIPLELVDIVAATDLDLYGEHGELLDAPACRVYACDDVAAGSFRTDLQLHLGATRLGLTRNRVFRWIGMTWLAGSAAVLLLSIRRIRRFQRLLKETRGGSWLEQDWVDEWAQRIGLRRAADLSWVPGAISPMIWFVGARPRLIIPQELWKRLDARQRSTLIVHELAHLRRGDHLVRLLELLVTALFWWHPLVWWMRVPLREVEEQCCDAWVVWALPDAVRAYAETLLDTLEFLQQSGRPDPLLASGLGKVPHLRRRLTMIMTGTSRRSPGLPGMLGLLLVAGTMLPVGASWAQKADESKDPRIVLSDDKLHVIGLPVELTSVPVNIEGPVAAIEGSSDAAAVVIRLEGKDQAGDKVELSGSLDDVVQKLEAKIAALKEKGEMTDAAKEQVKALAQALDALKKAHKSAATVTIHGDASKPVDKAIARVRVVSKVQTAGAGGEKSAEVAKTREEISKLQVSLKMTLGQLIKAQTKLRELGEDPGDTPSVTWNRSGKNFTLKKRIIETKDINAAKIVKPVQVREFTIARPVKPPAPAADQQRLEQLEKRLKALQDELARLKKGAADGSAK
jgi:beta-lactamase regulating signal transducer with metallopeptidase domain